MFECLTAHYLIKARIVQKMNLLAPTVLTGESVKDEHTITDS